VKGVQWDHQQAASTAAELQTVRRLQECVLAAALIVRCCCRIAKRPSSQQQQQQLRTLSCSSSSSSGSNTVPAEAVVVAARALRLLGGAFGVLARIQKNINPLAIRDQVVLKQVFVREAAAATDLLQKLLTQQQQQQQTGCRIGSSSSSELGGELVAALQLSWAAAEACCRQAAAAAAASNDSSNSKAQNALLPAELMKQLAQQQTALGGLLCAELALPGLCNNPSCADVSKSSEARMVTSNCSRCKTAR
jgi:hypothetical protein